MAGRPRKNPALREAQGLRSHKAKKKPAKGAPIAAPIADVQVTADPPAMARPPKWLAKSARAIWTAAAPSLQRKGLLVDSDAIAFGRYCDWLAQYLDIQRGARGRGVVTVTKSKSVKMQRMDKRFQALTIIDKRLSDYEDRFGMNPRERLAIMAKLAASAEGRGHAPPGPPADVDPAGKDRPGHVGPDDLMRSPVGFLSGRPN